MVKERTAALDEVRDTVNDQLENLKTNSESNIESLDAEAMGTIKNIIDANKQNLELSDYIASLGLDWFTIEWNDENRTMKENLPPADPYKGQGH